MGCAFGGGRGCTDIYLHQVASMLSEDQQPASTVTKLGEK